MAKRKKLFCSFCRKDETQVKSLIAGPGVHICGDCVSLCNRILDGKPTPGFAGWDSLTDEQLLAALPASEEAVSATGDVLHGQIDVLRERGVSWAAIGEALGVSRQAAWERFS
jgi:alkylhydroperoxidase family enzyme